MLEFRVGKDTAGPYMRRLAQALSSGEQMRAFVMGMNRTADMVNTAAVRAIQAEVGASSQKTIRRNISVRKATESNPVAIIQARSAKTDRIPIYELRARPRQPSKRRRPRGTGVTYGPTNKLIPGAFIARMRSGHIGVFQRVDRTSLPIVELKGPSVAWVFGSTKLRRFMQQFVDARLPLEVDRALARMLKVR